MTKKLKVQVFKKVPMSAEGLNRWNPKTRVELCKWIFITRKGWTIEVPVEQINSPNKMAEWVFMYFGEGRYQVRAFSPNKHAQGLRKGSMGVSAYTMVELVVAANDKYPEHFGHINEFHEKKLNRWKTYLDWKEDT